MKKQVQKELLNIVKDNYEQAAQDFSRTRGNRGGGWKELEKIIKDIPNYSSVIDVGCGNGRLLELLQDKKAHYIGVDNSIGLLKMARKRWPENKFSECNILDLGCISEYNFDYVFCIAVLHHLPGKDLRIKALRQLRNKINDKGRIILTVWNIWENKAHRVNFRRLIFKFWLLRLIGKNKMELGDVLFDWKNSQGEIVAKRYYHTFCKWQLKRTIKKSGLKIEKIYKDKYNYYAILKK